MDRSTPRSGTIRLPPLNATLTTQQGARAVAPGAGVTTESQPPPEEKQLLPYQEEKRQSMEPDEEKHSGETQPETEAQENDLVPSEPADGQTSGGAGEVDTPIAAVLGSGAPAAVMAS